MGDVIQFPGFDERAWREFEPTIRSVLKQVGGTAEMADWVCKDMKPRFLAVNLETTLPLKSTLQSYGDVVEAAKACTNVMHQATSQMLLQILNLEIELYGAMHPMGN